MTDEKSAANAQFLTKYKALEEEHAGQSQFSKEMDARFRVLEVATRTLGARPYAFDTTDIARAGAFLTIIAMATSPSSAVMSGGKMNLGNMPMSTMVNTSVTPGATHGPGGCKRQLDDDVIGLHKRIRHVGSLAAAKMEICASRS